MMIRGMRYGPAIKVEAPLSETEVLHSPEVHRAIGTMIAFAKDKLDSDVTPFDFFHVHVTVDCHRNIVFLGHTHEQDGRLTAKNHNIVLHVGAEQPRIVFPSDYPEKFGEETDEFRVSVCPFDLGTSSLCSFYFLPVDFDYSNAKSKYGCIPYADAVIIELNGKPYYCWTISGG